jgi:hypothetical protein
MLLPQRVKTISISGLALLHEEPCPLGLQTVFLTPSLIPRAKDTFVFQRLDEKEGTK